MRLTFGAVEAAQKDAGEGNARVMEEWVKAYTTDLLRFARARLADDATAEDLVQLTFVSAWRTMDRFQGQSSPRTWLIAILKHKLADHYRKVYRESGNMSGMDLSDDSIERMLFRENGHWRDRPLDDPSVFNEEPENERMDRALHHCLDLLPPNLRSAVELKYLSNKDSKRIQQELGISETNYWQQVHRAKLKLRACIEGRLIRGV